MFNRVGSDGHYRLLKAAVEQGTEVAALGYLRPDAALIIPDRHLGLAMATEQGDGQLYYRLAKAALDTVDLDGIETLAHSCGTLSEAVSSTVSKSSGHKIRIGVAQDEAFCFYYQDNLDLLEEAGAEIVTFSPLNDQLLPNVEMLYLGGGYPELYGEMLAKNTTMRAAIKRFADRGGVIYAECGGLMYLTESVQGFGGCSHDMVGIFPAETVMQKSGLTLGYRTVECSRGCIIGDVGATARGHEFHYSALVPKGPLPYACTMSDTEGLSQGQDGLMSGNVLALYTHLHFASQPEIAASLVESAHRAASRIFEPARSMLGADR